MQLNPSIKSVWILDLSIKNIIQTIFLAVLIFFLKSNFELSLFNLSWLEIILIVFAIRQVFAFIYPLFLYNSYDFNISNDLIIIKRGVLNKIETHIPQFRLQHIDVSQTWIERLFELSSLIIYTAGTKGGILLIPGLPLYFAEEMREKLKSNIKEDNV